MFNFGGKITMKHTWSLFSTVYRLLVIWLFLEINSCFYWIGYEVLVFRYPLTFSTLEHFVHQLMLKGSSISKSWLDRRPVFNLFLPSAIAGCY